MVRGVMADIRSSTLNGVLGEAVGGRINNLSDGKLEYSWVRRIVLNHTTIDGGASQGAANPVGAIEAVLGEPPEKSHV